MDSAGIRSEKATKSLTVSVFATQLFVNDIDFVVTYG
jgi:hypothetical protein